MSKIIGGILEGDYPQNLSGANRANVDLSGNGDEIIEVYRSGVYAVYSRPLPKTKIIMLAGREAIIVSEERNGQIPALEEGDFAIDTGNVKMHFKHASKEIEISGAVKITLGEGAQALVTEQIVDWCDSHTHPFPGGNTGTPTVPAKTAKESFTTKIVKGA